MKSKLGTAMEDIDESIRNIVSIAEEIELAKLHLNKGKQDQASGGTDMDSLSEEDAASSNEFYDCEAEDVFIKGNEESFTPVKNKGVVIK